MNKGKIEKYKKEYENMSLCDLADELVEPLLTIKKELAKTIYIHYAKERDKNYKLQQENQELQKQLEEAIKYISSNDIEVLKYHDIPSETSSYEIVTVDLLKILKGEIINFGGCL